MAASRRLFFIRGQIAWMVGTILVLVVLGELSLERFFIASFIGFLTIVEFTAPVGVTPQWRTRLKWFILLGLLVLGYVIGTRLREVEPSTLL